MGFMKKIKILCAALALGFANFPEMLHSHNDLGSAIVDRAIINDPEFLKKDVESIKSTKATNSKKKSFLFKFTDENLIDVINIVAEKKHINIALPAGANAITSKVTISVEEKMSIDEAWIFLIKILDIAGYSVVPNAGIYQIVKTTEAVTREALPIYIGVPWDQIPESDQRIRCVFYLSNIKVPNDPPEPENELYKIITTLMPNGQAGAQSPALSRLAFDTVTNAVIIAERATIIRSIMQIVSALDTTGFKEKIEILPLYNTVSVEVKQIFDEIYKPTQSTSPYRLDARKPTAEATYFSKFVRIFPYSRLNMLIVLGREQAVDRVTDFVKKYIDVPQDEGESVFHTYALQYLDAAEFSQILQNIVNSAASGGTGQSRAEGAPATSGGTERMFEGVIITHDKVVDQPQGGTEEKAKAIYYGGNRLIVAARRDDWLRIKKLCEELDTPQPQVIIEVLIADLTLDDSRAIGSMLRNPLRVPLIDDVQFQSAQLARGILVNDLNLNGGQSPATVGLDNQNHNNDTDILKDAYDSSGNALAANGDNGATSNTSILSQVPVGATAISLIDPCTKKVWSLLEIKNLLDYRKVLTNPHIVAVNNKQTQLVIGQSRLLKDAAVGNQGGNATVPRKNIEANLTLNIKPRISLSPDGDPANDTIQLGIVVTIDEFTEGTFTSQTASEGNRYIRRVETSAHVRNHEVIPLGGLLERTSSQSATETPILSRIPIIGYFFKNRGSTAADTNLTVFLCPTVVRPRLRRGGVDRYTRDYVKLTKKYAQEGLLFDSLKDPVTRWFFNTESDVVDTVNDFLADDEFKRDKEVRILTKRSQARQQARTDRTAKDLEYQEMNADDEDARLMQGDSLTIDEDKEEQMLAMHSEVIKQEKMQAQNQEVINPLETIQVVNGAGKEEQNVALDSQALESEVLKSCILEQACPLKTTQVAAQDILSPVEKEKRLKDLIENENNPLQEYLPA
jgi:general secretion pathway protein D